MKRKMRQDQEELANKWSQMKIHLVEIANGSKSRESLLHVPYSHVEARQAILERAMAQIDPAFHASIRIWFHGDEMTPNLSMDSITSRESSHLYPIAVTYSTSIPSSIRPTPEMSKSILLLDVDGVLNSVHDKPHDDLREDTYFSGMANRDLRLRWSPWVIEQVKRWATIVEIKWATSWGTSAQYILAPKLGLPHFELFAPHRKFWPELPEAYADYRILWLDDEFWWTGTMDHYRSHCRDLACVRVEDGLTSAHVALVDTILKRWSADKRAFG